MTWAGALPTMGPHMGQAATGAYAGLLLGPVGLGCCWWPVLGCEWLENKGSCLYLFPDCAALFCGGSRVC